MLSLRKIPHFAQEQTVGQWLNGQSYQKQYDFGIQTLKKSDGNNK